MMSLNCPCCGTPFLTASPARGQSPEAFAAAWQAMVAAVPVCNCTSCEVAFRVVVSEDPQVPVALVNISKPAITGVNTPSVPRTGGTFVFIQGKALDVGALQVRFNGVPSSQVDQRNATSARVRTPPASYALSVAEQCARLTLTPVMGAFSVGEAFTAPNGSTGAVRRISGAQHTIFFSSLAGSLAALVGATVVGNSGAVAVVAGATVPYLQPGEMVSGDTSAAMAVVRTAAPLVVEAPTGAFVENELVTGATSGAIVRLAPSAPYSGAVELTVENEYGRRAVGATLIGALSYV